MEDISLFDIVTISLIVVLGFKGLIRGFIKEAFGLVGIVGGVFIASRTADNLGEILGGFIGVENSSTAMLLGFVSSLLIFWSLAYILGLVVYKIADKSGLGMFDKFLGFGFGTAKVFLIFSISIYAMSSIEFVAKILDEKNKNSIMYGVFKSTGSYILAKGGQTPEEIDKIVEKKLKQLAEEKLKIKTEK